MGKIFTVLVISVCAASTCSALGLELSDVIKEAREIEKTKLSQNQTEEKSIKPVKNQNNQKENLCEQNACEKINPQEILGNNSK